MPNYGRCEDNNVYVYVASHMHALRKKLGVGISSNEIHFACCKTTQPMQEEATGEKGSATAA